MPRVSVILTSYNHGKWLREAIDSVLKQTFQDFELIIWDDASTDDSWDIIKSYDDPRIRAFRNKKNAYSAPLREAFLDVATCDYIAIHHSDDAWELNKLEKQVEILDKRPEIGAVFSWVSIMGDKGQAVESLFAQPNRTRHEWLRHFLLRGNALCHPSVLIRRRCYQDCGGIYRLGMRQLPDFDMWVRLCLKYEIHVIPEPLVRFRWHGSNTSAPNPAVNNRTSFETYLILKNYRQIDQLQDVLRIFPEAARHLGQNDSDTEFVLAMALLDTATFASTRLFAQEMLYELFKDPARVARVKELHGFDHQDFMKITGENPLFAQKSQKSILLRAFRKFKNRVNTLLHRKADRTSLHRQADSSAALTLAKTLHRTGRTSEAISLLQTLAEIESSKQAAIQGFLLELLLEGGNFSGFAQWSQKLLSEKGGFCPVCDAVNVHWLPLPDFYRQQSERYGFQHFDSGEMTPLETYSCPHCGASDRERLYALFLMRLKVARSEMPGQFMIHFAPEPALSKHIRQQRYFASCATADMSMPNMDFRADLQNLPFEDNSYDFFICSHVLEHVPDDRQAIRELYRITKPGGCGLLMAPIALNIEKTQEDPSITDEGERWRLFGQGDHVRLYSHEDYVARIMESGFSLLQMTQDDLGRETFSRLGLKSTSILYVVSKETPLITQEEGQGSLPSTPPPPRTDAYRDPAKSCTIKFCAYLFNDINFEPDALQPCCDTLKVGVPRFPFSGGDVDMQAYTQHIQKTLMTLQESEKVCAGCHFLQEIPYQDFSAAVPRFRTVSLNKHRHWCNLRCEYCDLWEERSDSYDILPPIKSIHQQGALQKGCSFSWGGGEPSILKEFEATSTWIAEQGYPQYVHTNAVRFSPAICHLLQTGRGAINVSLDASCKETYQAMKGVNAFDRVVRNLRRYIEAAQDKKAVVLKYIVYSRNNDPQEIMGFCELCQQLGVRKIQFSLDFRDINTDNVSDESLRSALLLYKTARKMGIECEPFFVKPQILQKIMPFRFLFIRALRTIASVCKRVFSKLC